MQNQPFKDNGFTAIEVLVAATVLLVALLGVATMFISGTRNMASGGARSQATYFAQEKLEELGNTPAFPPAPVAPAAPASDSPAPGLTRTWVVSSLIGTAPSRLATVTVDVAWTDSIGPKSLQAITYLAEQ